MARESVVQQVLGNVLDELEARWLEECSGGAHAAAQMQERRVKLPDVCAAEMSNLNDEWSSQLVERMLRAAGLC